MEINKEMITSAANKKVRNVMLLSTKSKERRKQKLFVVEGVKMFLEAPDERIREVYVSEELLKDKEGFLAVSNKLAFILQQKYALVETVKKDIFQKMCDTKTPQGILCLVEMPEYEFEKILDRENGLFLVLEDIQDPGNLGTMIRAGEGAGVKGVIMSSHTVDVYNPKTIRATMGSIYRIPVVCQEDLADSIKIMKRKGIRTYAAHLEGENAYDKEDYHKATAFLIGNEGNGLSRPIADLADSYVKIPMLGKVESLNAAIAATLFMYEAARQRRN